MGSFCNIGLLVGLTVAFILSWIFLTEVPSTFDAGIDYGIYGFNSWRVMFAFPAVTCIIRLIGFLFIYKRNLP
jgi:hypothetical protein